VRNTLFLLLPALLYLLACMFLAALNAGIRYVFPILPMLCVWLGGLVTLGRPGRRAAAPAGISGPEPAAAASGPKPAAAAASPVPRALFRAGAWGSLLLLAIETAAAAPWYLPFFNWPSGGPGGGDRLVNDSNVDWGQGLIALRQELKRRGIGKIYLTCHGTTDPAIYGIDYEPFLGGAVGDASDYIAVSSYYFVGLTQRMMTQRGSTAPVRFDFRELRDAKPLARPARCMYLFRIP
jgi:hypothetical protein